MQKYIEMVLDRVWLVLLLFGVGLVIVSALGRIPIGQGYEIQGEHWRIAIALLGILFLFFAMRCSEFKTGENIFFAFPMAAFEDENEYKKNREEAMKIIQSLRSSTGIREIYFSGEKADSFDKFENFGVAAQGDLRAVDKCKYFVMVFPEKITSSVIFEAGYALAKRKTSIYFVKDRNHLPYLMRELPTLSLTDKFPRIKLCTFTDYNDLNTQIKNVGASLISHK